MNSQTNRTKIPSFTLSELLMVMLLTVLISGICYMVLGYVQKKITVFTTHVDTSLHINTVEHLITNDLNRFDNIHWFAQNNMIVFKNPIDSVMYEFKDNALLRNKVLLLEPINKKAFFFRGVPIPSGVLDAFVLEIQDPVGLPLKIFFTQPKSAALYVPKSF